MKLVIHTLLLPFISANPLSQSLNFSELISKLQSIDKSWTSGHNTKFDLLKSTHDYDYLNGVLNVTKVGKDLPTKTDYTNDQDLPSNFDWRESAGDMCPSLMEIRDQGHCQGRNNSWDEKRVFNRFKP